jgi:hypothetical protein
MWVVKVMMLTCELKEMCMCLLKQMSLDVFVERKVVHVFVERNVLHVFVERNVLHVFVERKVVHVFVEIDVDV